MEIREVTDNIAIYSDGKRLQVIHDLGDEFVLLKWAIRQFEIFEQYLNDYQADLLEWYKNAGGEDD